MTEEKKEKWLSYLALTTVIFAVCATLSTFKGGSFSTRSVLAQSQASNQWSYYQAKSIKGYIYEVQKERLELEQKAGRLPKNLNDDYLSRIDTYDKKIKKYEDEKKQIEKDAKEQEAIKIDAQKHSQIFGMAVIFLQIAILLSSIAALMKRKSIWFLSLVPGVLGLVYFCDGFFLFMK
ncbi:MAG: DUF4337 domain-containing protein [Nitrospiraceae bacterium]|nr:DUF4337 domain-containing protein [Nitrospiraceae bacterium]